MKDSSRISEELDAQLRVKDKQQEEEEKEEKDAGAGGIMEEDEEEFSFMCGGGSASPIAAEDAFVNGQIKVIFPLFTEGGLPETPQVKNVFVEMEGEDEDDDEEEENKVRRGSFTENGEVSGPYCEWSKDAQTAPAQAPEGCKKSNSTGFSRLRRFRDLLHRSNSEGRDAFVFLNSQPASVVVKKEEKKPAATTTSAGADLKVNEKKGKLKKGGKSSKALSPHEVYLKSKAKEDDRKRSYLPYRPEVFGFFTNVNGGMSKNVHPF